MKKFIFGFVIFCCLSSAALAQKLKSPDGQLVLEFSLTTAEVPAYQLFYKSKAVTKLSTLGFVLKDQEDLLNGFTVNNVENSTYDQTWEPVWGEQKQIRLLP